jgi:hypothetical protein
MFLLLTDFFRYISPGLGSRTIIFSSPEFHDGIYHVIQEALHLTLNAVSIHQTHQGQQRGQFFSVGWTAPPFIEEIQSIERFLSIEGVGVGAMLNTPRANVHRLHQFCWNTKDEPNRISRACWRDPEFQGRRRI